MTKPSNASKADLRSAASSDVTATVTQRDRSQAAAAHTELPDSGLETPYARGRRWLSSRRNRWVTAGAGTAALLIVVWLFARRSSRAAEVPAKSDTIAAKASDSILTLDEEAQRLAGVELLAVTRASGGTLVANGAITFDANRVSVVSSRVEGRIVSVRADLGQAVRAGGLLAELESSEVGQIRGDLERAKANVETAHRNYEREKRLFEEQISPQKEMLEAEAAYRSAEADNRSAIARLTAIGAAGGDGAAFGLRSPVSGTVVERNASPGQTVGPTTNLFTVADLRNVWITVDVYEGDLSRVRQGAAATVMPTALPGESFTGRVTYAGGVVDTASHTFKVRVEVANSALRLRPGMFAQVRLQTAAGPGTGSGTITVPEMAVQDVNGKQVVFVAGPRSGQYVVRPVTVGPRGGGGTIVVTEGLEPGERIVTKGAFQLKAELTKSSFGESE